MPRKQPHGQGTLEKLPRPVKSAKVAVIEFVPYDDPDNPGQPAYALYSALGYCDLHDRMEKLTSYRSVSTGVDICRIGVLDCGRINREGIF